MTQFDTVTGDIMLADRGVTHENADVKQILPIGKETLEVHGVENKLSTDVSEQLRTLLEVPATLLDRLQPDTSRKVMAELWRFAQRKISGQEVTISRKGGQIIGFSKAELVRIDNRQILNALHDTLADHRLGDAEVRQQSVEATGNFRLGITFPRIAAEPRVGDVVQAGLRLRHSPVGQHPTTLDVLLYRLACRNGMLAPVCQKSHAMRIRRYEGGGSLELLDRFTVVANEAIGQLQQKVDELVTLANTDAEPEKELRSIARRNRYNRRIAQQLQVALYEDEAGNPGETQYDVLMALSRVATHFDLTDRQRRELMRFSGLYSQSHHTRRCPFCNSLIRGNPNHN